MLEQIAKNIEKVASPLLLVKMDQVLVPANEVTAKHILAEQYLKYTEQSIAHKILVYLALINKYGMPKEKDKYGNYGYRLKFLPPPLSSYRSTYEHMGLTLPKAETLVYLLNIKPLGWYIVYPNSPTEENRLYSNLPNKATAEELAKIHNWKTIVKIEITSN